MSDTFSVTVLKAAVGELRPRETDAQRSARREQAIADVMKSDDVSEALRKEAADDLRRSFAMKDAFDGLMTQFFPNVHP